MKCNNIDNIVIWILVFTIFIDFFALFTELFNQRCKYRAEKDRIKNEDKVNQELNDLRNRIAVLESTLAKGII